MASEIIRVKSGTSLMKRALNGFVSMIGNREYLYDEAWRLLKLRTSSKRYPSPFHDRDIEVNELEKEIRRLYLGITDAMIREKRSQFIY